LDQSLQVLTKDRQLDLIELLGSFRAHELTGTNVRDLFFLLARQSAFHTQAREYGLTYVPQFGQEAGKIFHYMTAARIDNVGLRDIILRHSHILSDSDQLETAPCLPKGFEFVSSELSHYSKNSIGIAWCVVKNESRTKEVTSSIEQCAMFIEFITQKAKLASAFNSLIKLNFTPKATEGEIDKQLVESLQSAAFPHCVMLWRVDHFSQKVSVCTGTEKRTLQLNFGEGAAGKCALEKKTLVIDDFRDHAELKSKGITHIRHPKFIEALGLRSGIFEPIVLDDHTDTVAACYFRRPGGVTQTERDIVRFITNNSRYYRHLLKIQDSQTGDKDNLAKVAALVKFARDARSYVHDASSLVGRADEQLFLLNPKTEDEVQAKKIAVDNLSQAKNLLSISLTLTEPPKTVRAGGVLFERDDDIARHNVTRIIEGVIATYAAEASESGISFNVGLDKDMRFSLSASQLRRALSNLIDNAIYELKRSSSKEKIIEVEASLITVNNDPRDKLVDLIIHVRDNGPGIDKEIFNKLADYFVTTKGSEGYGFGMAIVQDIMKAHGGSLEWRNRSTKRGAEFELRFPHRG
jgi:signal transduction histidine kinase